jgi:L-amino acid N-acyltransferase YncA
MSIDIIPFQVEHWETVQCIYQEGIDTGLATFETQAPEWDTWNQKFNKDCRIVCFDKSELLGWAALQPVSVRNAYKGVAEVSVYVKMKKTGLGIGSKLLAWLVLESESNDYWMLSASIFKENEPSIHLHKKMGFHVVGVRERIAQHNGIWVDTVLMDRRSQKTGN